MREAVAAELGQGETIVEDDYVGISRGQQLGKRAARKSLPRFGIAIATTERLRIATVEDEVVTSLLLEDVEVSHDEDNVLTLTISTFGQPTESLTLVFPKRRSPVAQFLTRIFRSEAWRSHENALRPGMIGVATHQSNPEVRRAFSWFKVAV